MGYKRIAPAKEKRATQLQKAAENEPEIERERERERLRAAAAAGAEATEGLLESREARWRRRRPGPPAARCSESGLLARGLSSLNSGP